MDLQSIIAKKDEAAKYMVKEITHIWTYFKGISFSFNIF